MATTALTPKPDEVNAQRRGMVPYKKGHGIDAGLPRIVIIVQYADLSRGRHHRCRHPAEHSVTSDKGIVAR